MDTETKEKKKQRDSKRQRRRDTGKEKQTEFRGDQSSLRRGWVGFKTIPPFFK